jgi:ABC-2 type transport system ATP-binding protein
MSSSADAYSATQVVLQAKQVNAGYGQTTIVRDLNMTVHAGEIYALLGGNGAGKTTTLSLFLGFVQAQSGVILVNGIDAAIDADGARRQLAYIPENVALYEHLTAYENVAYLLDLAEDKQSKSDIEAALLTAGLASAAHHLRVAGFSKGMRQKVAIALAFIRRVPVLLLDEPTSGLDPQAAAEFHRLLGVLREQGVAMLMVTHDLLSAAEVADRIGFIEGGRLTEEVAASDDVRFDVHALYQRYAGSVRA